MTIDDASSALREMILDAQALGAMAPCGQRTDCTCALCLLDRLRASDGVRIHAPIWNVEEPTEAEREAIRAFAHRVTDRAVAQSSDEPPTEIVARAFASELMESLGMARPS